MDDRIIGNTLNVYEIKKGSKIKIGNRHSLTITVDQQFNWFQKKMIKLFFGFTVEDFNKEECNE